MSDGDFEVVRRAWAAASGADAEGLRRELHPEVVAVPFGAAMEGRAYRGPDQVLAWLRDEILVSWDFFEVHPEQFERVGEKLLVTGRWSARGLESGVELDIPATWLARCATARSPTGAPTPIAPRRAAMPGSRTDVVPGRLPYVDPYRPRGWFNRALRRLLQHAPGGGSSRRR